MAQGTFAPIYMEIEKDLIARHERVMLDILRGLAWHADELGMCWPGVRRLAEVTRRSENTIAGYIQDLLNADMIRVHLQVDNIRRKTMMTYQVSPYVIYIREELEPQAIKLWLTGENVINETGFVTKHVQPDIEPEKEPESNQKQGTKKRSTTTTKSRKSSVPSTEGAPPDGSTPASSANGHGKNNRQRNPIPQSDGQNEQPTGENQQPQGDSNPATAGRGKQTVDLAAFRAALPDIADELLAGRLARRFSTRETQARQIVSEHGYQSVETAIRWIDTEIAKGRPIESPMGLLRWWLKNNCISPTDTPGSNLTAGYDEFFSH